MHLCMKIPRHASKNPIAAGDFKWIFARNCEGTEQLQLKMTRIALQVSRTFDLNIEYLGGILPCM